MKLTNLIILCLFLIATASVSVAQYDSYVNIVTDQSGLIQQTVVLEGAIPMNYVCPWQCGQYNWCSPNGGCNAHWPSIYNRLGSVGGWTNFQHVLPQTYISDVSVVTTPYTSGITGNVQSQVYCAVVNANVFSLPFSINIGGAYTKEVWIGGQLNGFCAVTRACTNTATPMCYSAGIYVGDKGSCSPAWDSYFGTYQINSGPIHCFTIGMSLPTNDTSPEWCTPAQ